MRRRAFLRNASLGAVALLTRDLNAQDSPPAGTSQDPQESGSNLFPMDQEAAKSVRRPPKANARPQLDAAARDSLEHQLRCQCGCTLDVYTCRTTDFSCQVSPAMHRDVMALVAGGYDAQEIISAFVDTYGEQVLMAPTRQGFNLVGWIMPFAALAAGGAVVATLVRRWGRRADAVRSAERDARGPGEPAKIDATAEELASLEAEIRGEDR